MAAAFRISGVTTLHKTRILRRHRIASHDLDISTHCLVSVAICLCPSIPADVVAAAEVGEADDGQACNVCLSIFDAYYTVSLCHEQIHVWCINCAIDVFTQAATCDSSLIPLNCDGKEHPSSVDALRHVLPDGIRHTYKSRLEEKQSSLKVYCSNIACGKFLPPRTHAHDHLFSYAKCTACTTSTCVGCGDEWQQEHRCNPAETTVDLPPYSSNMRIKQCPSCRHILELTVACNHMTCDCGHQFCFVCLRNWDDWHECPRYKDPEYDEELRDWRGLHVRTGLDTDGYDRDGNHANGSRRAPQKLREPKHVLGNQFGGNHHDDEQDEVMEDFEDDFDENEGPVDDDWRDEDEEREMDDDELAAIAERNDELYDAAPEDDDEWVAQENIEVDGDWDEAEVIDDESESEDDQQPTWPRLPRQPRLPVPTGPPSIAVATIEQVECRHSITYRGTSMRCFGCQWLCHSFHYYCLDCGIVTCRMRSGSLNYYIIRQYGHAATGFCIDVMERLIIEQDVKDKLLAFYKRYPFEEPGAMYNIEDMFLPFEEKYARWNALVGDSDFGISLMFAPEIEKYEAARHFHTAFRISRPGRRPCIEEVPLGNATWFSFLDMSPSAIDMWECTFLVNRNDYETARITAVDRFVHLGR